MTLKELETYILSNANVQKQEIPQWRYIRYTVYASLFASIGETKAGLVLTVWGRYGHYEKEYSDAIVPALDNNPETYTSILLSKNVPDHMTKAMIDYSYRYKLSEIPIPQPYVKGYENVPYCGIAASDNGNSSLTQKELAATVEKAKQSHADCDYTSWKVQPTATNRQDVEGAGQFDHAPYRIVNDDEKMRAYKMLLRQECNKKSEKQ